MRMRNLNVEPVEIEPLVQIRGEGLGYKVTCRDCGDLPDLAREQSIIQAGMVQGRHLAAHLRVLAAEIAEASR